MTRSEFIEIELAKAYVALSNAHRLDLIDALFADEAKYVSANVGVYEGKVAIAQMMADFFDRFSDVAWAATRFQHAGAHTVSFDFTMTGTATDTGQRLERSASERLRFSSQHQIVAVEVD